MRALFSAVAAILVMAAPASAASTTLVINEVDYDQPSTDTAEFLEIKNVATTAINLDPYQLRFVNGANGLNYLIVNLPAVELAGGDRYVVCANPANTPNCDLDVTPETNLIQNGDPDGVVLETAAGPVDGLAYGPGSMPGVGEGSTAVTDTATAGQGIARVPDGCDTDDNAADFERAAITPGASNGEPACGGPPADAARRPVDPAGRLQPRALHPRRRGRLPDAARPHRRPARERQRRRALFVRQLQVLRDGDTGGPLEHDRARGHAETGEARARCRLDERREPRPGRRPRHDRGARAHPRRQHEEPRHRRDRGGPGQQRRDRRRDRRGRRDVRHVHRGDRGRRRADVRLPPDRPRQQPGRRPAGRQHPRRLPVPHGSRPVVRRPPGR